MERKKSTEPRKRVIQRSLSCSSKNDVNERVVASIAAVDEADKIHKKATIDGVKKPDLAGKNKNRALYNKLQK